MAREPVCATCEAAVPHVLKKTAASNERYHGSSCSCGQTGDRVCKEIQELAMQTVLLQPLHDTIVHRKNGGTSTVCVFRSLVTGESLESHLTCDQHREHDATAHDACSI